MSTGPQARERRNRRTAMILAGVAAAMFGFGFALVPLYTLVCASAGIQAISLRTPIDGSRPAQVAPDSDRQLVVKFDTVIHPELPWTLQSEVPRIEVRPGESYSVTFVAENRSSATMTGQAIPNIVPWQATPYFHKVECFCFSRQTLTGGERIEMPLRFIVSPDLPEEINSLTLSYSFMRLDTEGAALELVSNGTQLD